MFVFNVRCVIFHFFHVIVKICVVFVVELNLRAIPIKYGQTSLTCTHNKFGRTYPLKYPICFHYKFSFFTLKILNLINSICMKLIKISFWNCHSNFIILKYLSYFLCIILCVISKIQTNNLFFLTTDRQGKLLCSFYYWVVFSEFWTIFWCF